jgi:hypothetical protein
MAPQPTIPIDFNAMIANAPLNRRNEESPTTSFIYLEAFSAVNEGRYFGTTLILMVEEKSLP